MTRNVDSLIPFRRDHSSLPSMMPHSPSYIGPPALANQTQHRLESGHRAVPPVEVKRDLAEVRPCRCSSTHWGEGSGGQPEM